MYDAFNSLDLNADGRITRDEFKRIIQSRGFYVSEKEVDEIVEKMDKNKDGRVSFAEVSILSKKLMHLFRIIFIVKLILIILNLFSSLTKSDQEALKDTERKINYLANQFYR